MGCNALSNIKAPEISKVCSAISCTDKQSKKSRLLDREAEVNTSLRNVGTFPRNTPEALKLP
jgi:hypothetical protein